MMLLTQLILSSPTSILQRYNQGTLEEIIHHYHHLGDFIRHCNYHKKSKSWLYVSHSQISLNLQIVTGYSSLTHHSTTQICQLHSHWEKPHICYSFHFQLHICTSCPPVLPQCRNNYFRKVFLDTLNQPIDQFLLHSFHQNEIWGFRASSYYSQILQFFLPYKFLFPKWPKWQLL